MKLETLSVMKCFLHIGTAKTATTTIQNFLDINRDSLLEKDYIYTKSAGKTNNRGLSASAYHLSRRDEFTKQLLIDSDAKLLKFQKQTIRNLTKEIATLNKDSSKSTIIFSSEHFQSRLTHIEEIERLREIIYSFGVTDISVVVYLRRPADIANSLYSTAIKTGGHRQYPPSPKHPSYNNLCNHKNTLEKFGTVFGESALIPRLFDKNEFINGSIIDDLLNIFGIPNDDKYEVPKNLNESLSVVGVNLLRRINNTIPKWVDDKPNLVRANLVSYFARHFSDSKYVMPKRLYEAYDLEFQESNDWVRRKYFPDKKKMFSDHIIQEAKLSISEEELDRIANFIIDIWSAKQTRIMTLRKKNKNLKKKE